MRSILGLMAYTRLYCCNEADILDVSVNKYPLFPLSAHILPGGRMSLRIFEPRYTRMIKEACANDSGFVICMLNAQGDKDQNQHIHPVGTFCKVVDFDVLEDGLLGIKVDGLHLVAIDNVETEQDGLRVGHCSNFGAWQCTEACISSPLIVSRLQEIFERYPELNELYTNPRFNDPTWVVHRWLELVPVSAEYKQELLSNQDCHAAINFLNDLIE